MYLILLLGVNKTRFLFRINRLSENADLMKVYVIQSKCENMMIIGVSLRN